MKKILIMLLAASCLTASADQISSKTEALTQESLINIDTLFFGGELSWMPQNRSWYGTTAEDKYAPIMQRVEQDYCAVGSADNADVRKILAFHIEDAFRTLEDEMKQEGYSSQTIEQVGQKLYDALGDRIIQNTEKACAIEKNPHAPLKRWKKQTARQIPTVLCQEGLCFRGDHGQCARFRTWQKKFESTIITP